MTTTFMTTVRCSVCGHESSQRVIGSTNAFGYSDLDLRPPEMQRSTMHMWLQTCPHCGYVAPDLSDETEVTEEWLASPDYHGVDDLVGERLPELAATFYRRSLIAALDGCHMEAAQCLLRAAWACDDRRLVRSAKAFRQHCVALIDEHPDGWDDGDRRMQHIDILRRAGEFARAVEECKREPFDREILEEIAEFEVQLAQEARDACYTVGHALGELPLPSVEEERERTEQAIELVKQRRRETEERRGVLNEMLARCGIDWDEAGGTDD